MTASPIIHNLGPKCHSLIYSHCQPPWQFRAPGLQQTSPPPAPLGALKNNFGPVYIGFGLSISGGGGVPYPAPQTLLRHEQWPEGECNCFWHALNSTSQLENPHFSILTTRFRWKICNKHLGIEHSTSCCHSCLKNVFCLGSLMQSRQTSNLFHCMFSLQYLQGIVLRGQSFSKCCLRSFFCSCFPHLLGQLTSTNRHSSRCSYNAK